MVYKICMNDEHRFTLTYFTARSNLVAYGFILETDRKSLNGK